MRHLVNAAPDSAWLDHAACADAKLNEFFVEAGHVIDDKTQQACRTCPVRLHCAVHVFRGGWTQGYFAALSPGHRRRLKTIEEIIDYVRKDTEEAFAELGLPVPEPVVPFDLEAYRYALDADQLRQVAEVDDPDGPARRSPRRRGPQAKDAAAAAEPAVQDQGAPDTPGQEPAA